MRLLPPAAAPCEKCGSHEIRLRYVAPREWIHIHGFTEDKEQGEHLRLTPDFLVINSIGEVEMHECKGGFIREDAAIKLKVAASTFPFRFKLAQKKGKNWTITEVAA